MPQLHSPEKVRLSSGIPVILQHYDGPVAAIYWWNRVGSADEQKGEEGFAHFLEHMLFKDAAAKETGIPSSGRMAREIESLGGDVNAYTSFDQTVYHVTCADRHWEKVLGIFGDMARPQRFLKEDFAREREVILEELRRNEDSPGRQLFQKLFSTTFRRHPYGRPVIGHVRTLKAANVGRLEAFYRRNYVASKMGIILVGPMASGGGSRRRDLLRILERSFGGRKIPAGNGAAPRERVNERPLLPGPGTALKHFDVKTPSAAVSFRVPSLLHPDIPALDLAIGALGMGESSRLYRRLFYKDSLVTDVGAALYVPRDPGMAYFTFEFDSADRADSVSRAFFEELAVFTSTGPSKDEIERVIVSAESERLYATQSADGLAGRLGFMEFVVGDLDYDRKYVDALKRTDAAEVRKAAAEYFDPRRMSAVLLAPKEARGADAGVISNAALTALAPQAPAVTAVEPAPRAPGVRWEGGPAAYARLPSGAQLVHRERPDSHVVSIHASVLGGSRLELSSPLESVETDWGASHMIAQTWTKGTAKRDSREISAIVEGRAAALDGFSGRNSLGLELTGLSKDWAELSALFNEVLVEPTFPESEVEHTRRVTQDSIRGMDDHSAQLCSRLFLETLYQKHPYGRLTLGSLESVGGMKREKLGAFHRAWIRPERLVLSVSGPLSRARVEDWARSLESRLGSAAVAAAEPAVPGPEAKPHAPRWAERRVGREQTHIMVGGLGTRIDSPDRFAVRILSTLLGGQSGRLFIELREKRSLAYTVSPMSFEGLEPGYIGIYMACAPSKRAEALDGIRKVVEKLAEKGPTATEMERAREFYLGRRAMELQGDSALASHFGLQALYGVKPHAEALLEKRIRAVMAKDVRAACAKYLAEPPLVTAVVS